MRRKRQKIKFVSSDEEYQEEIPVSRKRRRVVDEEYQEELPVSRKRRRIGRGSLEEVTRDVQQNIMEEMRLILRRQVDLEGQGAKKAELISHKFLELWKKNLEEENVRKKAPRKPQLTKPFNAYLPELATLPVPQRKPLPEEYKALVKQWNFPICDEDDDTDDEFELLHLPPAFQDHDFDTVLACHLPVQKSKDNKIFSIKLHSGIMNINGEETYFSNSQSKSSFVFSS